VPRSAASLDEVSPPPATAVVTGARARASAALRRRHNWIQLLRFCVVGASGYVVNLVLLAALIELAGLGKIVAQALAIIVVTPLNFLGNKLWSFRR
jgi:putative flippase GtrA